MWTPCIYNSGYIPVADWNFYHRFSQTLWYWSADLVWLAGNSSSVAFLQILKTEITVMAAQATILANIILGGTLLKMCAIEALLATVPAGSSWGASVRWRNCSVYRLECILIVILCRSILTVCSQRCSSLDIWGAFLLRKVQWCCLRYSFVQW